MQRVTDFSLAKFRCSALGQLMTGVKIGLTENQEKTFLGYDERYRGMGKPLTEKMEKTYFELGAKRSAKPELSTTTKSYLKELHRAQFLGRTNHLTMKYLDKGLMVEAQAITLLSEVEGKPFFKNQDRKENDFLTGMADNAKDKIRDIKSSWSLDTYPLYEDEVKSQGYLWQLQGYMELWDLEEAELIYCLVDTPSNLIEDELRRMDWKLNILSISGGIREKCIPLVVETISNHIFTRKGLEEFCSQSTSVFIDWFDDFVEIPEELRVKKYMVKRDPEMIINLYDQIRNAREYLNGLSLIILEHVK